MKDLKFLKKGQEILKIALINLALLLVFLELGSLGWYFIKHKQFFYTREKVQNKSDLGINLEGVRLNQSIVERFHPFFGFIQKPSADFRPGFKVNNYGFISPYDYPLKKTKKISFLSEFLAVLWLPIMQYIKFKIKFYLNTSNSCPV